MTKEIIKFPYGPRKVLIKREINEFKIHYYYREDYLEKDVYLCYSNSRDDNNRVGFLFSVERLHENNITIPNESDQRYFEAFMDIARELFYNAEKRWIKRYFLDCGLYEENDKVRIDEILKYKAFLESNNNNFVNEDIFEEFKNMRDFPLAIFIEDTNASEAIDFHSENIEIMMMLEHHFFPIQDTNDFYISKKHLELEGNVKFDERDKYEETNDFRLKKLIIRSISKDFKDDELALLTELLPKFYYQCYSIEYFKFSVLYQYVEVFIGLLGNKMLEDIMGERDEKNLFKLKSAINEILSEHHRIQKLFTKHSSVLEDDIKERFNISYNRIVSETNLMADNSSIPSQLYWVRNVLYHNLRVFNNKEVVDEHLRSLNVEFEKVIANILNTFSLNGNEDFDQLDD